MARYAYVDGIYQRMDQPAIYVEDRGYQFSDGVYEVLAVRSGSVIDETAHLKRLDYSLSELEMPWPVSRAVLQHIVREVIRRNRIRNGLIYIQISRGVTARDHYCPPNVHPVLVVTAKHVSPAERERVLSAPQKIMTVPDIRWGRPDIKSISLLPNIMARRMAKQNALDDAWMVDRDGYITEASAANAWIVDQAGKLRTHPLGTAILGGVTRQVISTMIEQLNIQFEERPFTVAELETARECFSTASTLVITPVGQVNGKQIGDGKAGDVTKRIAELYDSFATRD